MNNTAADFDSAMSKAAAVSGATGSDLEALRDKCLFFINTSSEHS